MPAPAHPLLAIWIIGCVVLLARDGIGWIRAMQLARRAVVANDRDMTRGLAEAAGTVGSRRQIVLAYSVDVESPIAFGIVKPVVLLPTEARSWSAARLGAVLVHEAAHVSRHDCVSQAIGRLACAMFWFHPLAWRAFAHLCSEAERAADDCVLNSGIPALEYASHLLDLARRATDARVDLVAVGMITQTDLERRFMSMLDGTRSRATVTARAQAATMAFALMMIGPLASFRVTAPGLQSRASLRQVLPPRAAAATRPAIAERRASQITTVATLPAMNVRAAAVESPIPPVAVIASATPNAVSRPNFSGKWTSDTTQIHTLEFDWVVADSTILRQTDDAISIEGRGHIMTSLTRRLLQTQNSFSNITFDGAPSTGYTVRGNAEANVTVGAVWMGDTLMLTSHSRGGHEFYTIERMWLSADGQTLFETNRSFVDGKDRWGGLTFIWHRMAPSPNER